MAVCAYCGHRKGKRACPALRGVICAVCCGTHRGAAIACPTNCVYFLPGETYQRERAGREFVRARQPLHERLAREQGDRGLVLLNLLDFACYGYAADHAGVIDQELLAGLEDIRARLSPLAVPASAPSACAQHLWSVVETWLKQEPHERDRLRAVLDQQIAFGRELAGRELAGRRFITGLSGMVEAHAPKQAEALRKKSDGESRIILPAGAVERR
jgi:hypothetical protein